MTTPILPFARPDATKSDAYEIKVLRFVTGEYVISKVALTKDGKEYILKMPMTFMPTPTGVSLVPFIPEFVTDDTMVVPIKNLFCDPMTPIKNLENTYRQGTSGLVTASADTLSRLPKIVPPANS